MVLEFNQLHGRVCPDKLFSEQFQTPPAVPAPVAGVFLRGLQVNTVVPQFDQASVMGISAMIARGQFLPGVSLLDVEGNHLFLLTPATNQLGCQDFGKRNCPALFRLPEPVLPPASTW